MGRGYSVKIRKEKRKQKRKAKQSFVQTKNDSKPRVEEKNLILCTQGTKKKQKISLIFKIVLSFQRSLRLPPKLEESLTKIYSLTSEQTDPERSENQINSRRLDIIRIGS